MTTKKIEFIKRITQKLNEFYTLDDIASVKRSALGDEINGFLEAGILKSKENHGTHLLDGKREIAM